MMSDSPQQSDNLEDVDREIRIERMKQELNEISGGEMIYGSLSPIPPAMEEAFLEQVLAYERADSIPVSTGSRSAASSCRRRRNSTTRRSPPNCGKSSVNSQRCAASSRTPIT